MLLQPVLQRNFIYGKMDISLIFMPTLRRKPKDMGEVLGKIPEAVRRELPDTKPMTIMDYYLDIATRYAGIRPRKPVRAVGDEEWGQLIFSSYKHALQVIYTTKETGEKVALRRHLESRTKQIVDILTGELPGIGHYWAGRLLFAKKNGSAGFDLYIEGALKAAENHDPGTAVAIFRRAIENIPSGVSIERVEQLGDGLRYTIISNNPPLYHEHADRVANLVGRLKENARGVGNELLVPNRRIRDLAWKEKRD